MSVNDHRNRVVVVAVVVVVVAPTRTVPGELKINPTVQLYSKDVMNGPYSLEQRSELTFRHAAH